MLRNRFNSRHQQLAKYIGQKIHSQLQHHHHQQGSLQQGNHGSQTPSQSFFNVMRLNRKGGLTLSAMVHPGVDPLAQQQHQQQQQGQLQTPGLQVSLLNVKHLDFRWETRLKHLVYRWETHF